MDIRRFLKLFPKPRKTVPWIGAIAVGWFTIIAWVLLVCAPASGESGPLLLLVCLPFTFLGMAPVSIVCYAAGIDLDAHEHFARAISFVLSLILNPLIAWVILAAGANIIGVIRRRL